MDRKPPDFSKRFLKLNELSVPNQRRFKRTPYAGAELGKFDPNQQTLEKGFRYLRSQVYKISKSDYRAGNGYKDVA